MSTVHPYGAAYLDRLAAADLLKISLPTFKRWRRAKSGFPGPKKRYGRHPLWLRTDLEAFINGPAFDAPAESDRPDLTNSSVHDTILSMKSESHISQTSDIS